MKILALDTATEACSVSLGIGDRSIDRYVELERGHAEQLLPMVDAVLAEGGITLGCARRHCFRARPGRLHRRAARGQRRPGTGFRCRPRRGAGLRSRRRRAARRPAESASAPRARRERCAHARGVLGASSRSAARPVLDGDEQVSARVGRGAARSRAVRAGLGRCRPRACAPGPSWPSAAARRAPTLYPDLLPRASEVLVLARPAVAAGQMLSAPEAALPVYVRDRVAARRGVIKVQ